MRRWLSSVIVALAIACDEGDPDAPGATLGAPCDGRCVAPLACVSDARFPGGYCTLTCGETPCPVEGLCEASGTAICLARCAGPADCRAGYQCWRGACRPACASDDECAGGTCVAATCDGPECVVDAECPAGENCRAGACAPLADGGGTLPAGSPCAAAAECLSGICLPATLGGACASPCAEADDCFGLAVDAACSAVPDGASGVRTLCTPLPLGGRALGSACALDEECEARTCQDGQCTEACGDDDDCRRGQRCVDLPRFGGTYRGCGYTALGAAARVEEVSFEGEELLAGQATELDLAIPPDAVSVTFQARRVSGDPLPLAFGSLTDASGARVYDLEEIFALRDTPLRWLPLDTGGAITMVSPSTTPDRLPLRRGTTRWTVGTLLRMEGDSGRCQVELSALIARAPGGVAPVGPLDLDLEIVLVGVGITAAAAPSSPRIQGALSRLAAILTPAGLRVGAVSYRELSGADATQYAVIDSTEGEESELAGLFRTSAGVTGRRVSVFLVRSIERDGDGFAALGIAGGIPGPVGMHGTEHSGVVLAIDESVVGTGTEGAAVVGHALAHELGHYLGLYHVTESVRPCGPGETPSDGCVPFGGGDVLADTTRGDTSNLMHWTLVGTGVNDRLSAGQSLVVRSSALVIP